MGDAGVGGGGFGDSEEGSVEMGEGMSRAADEDKVEGDSFSVSEPESSSQLSATGLDLGLWAGF